MEVKEIKTVVNNLTDFIEVPNGIDKLRNAVLNLAVRGLLVEQRSSEGTADSDYKKIKTQAELDEISKSEEPFSIPENWRWVRLGQIVETKIGKTPPRKDSSFWIDAEIPWASIADLKQGNHIGRTKECINQKSFEEVFNSNIAKAGSLLFSFKLTIGKMSIIDMDACHNEAIISLKPAKVETRNYLFKALRVLNLVGRTSSAIKGKTLNSKTFPLIEVPLPPLAEQKRIVERVDELMKLIDQLELEKKERDEVRGKMAVSAFYSFGTEHNDFALKHLTELVKTPSDVDELEKSILSLAVSGKLTPQDPEDGNAEDLYQEIRKEKESVGTSNKKIKPLSPITDEEIVFGIPANWKWVRLGDLAKVITDGEHISPTKTTEGVPLLTAKNATDNGVTFEKIDYVTKEDAAKFWNRCNPEKGDLLICSRGTIGRSVVVDTEEKFVLMGSVILIKFFNDETATFVRNYLRTQSGLLQIGAMKKGMAVNALYLKDIRNAVLPLPPIKEQTRIVAKVNELMILVQKLREVMDK